jgi:hypothetical protein
MAKRTTTPKPPKCDCCRKTYDVQSAWLKGLCSECSKGLGGGENSARIVKNEVISMRFGRRFGQKQERK